MRYIRRTGGGHFLTVVAKSMHFVQSFSVVQQHFATTTTLLFGVFNVLHPSTYCMKHWSTCCLIQTEGASIKITTSLLLPHRFRTVGKIKVMLQGPAQILLQYICRYRRWGAIYVLLPSKLVLTSLRVLIAAIVKMCITSYAANWTESFLIQPMNASVNYENN